MPNLWLSFDPPHLCAGIVDSIRKNYILSCSHLHKKGIMLRVSKKMSNDSGINLQLQLENPVNLC